MKQDNFALNLQHLCAQKKSISAVSRELGINRQQFSRYLNGTNRPGRHTLNKICTYFGVTSEDLDLETGEFAKLVSQLPTDATILRLPSGITNEILWVASHSQPHLSEYVGFYHRYYYAYGFPGYVFKSFTVIRQVGTYYVSKHIVRIPRRDAPTDASVIFKFNGVLLDFCGRLFLLERVNMDKGSLCQTIFAPIYRPGTKMLSGLANSISSAAGNDPAAARVVMEYLGPEIDMRAALRNCGLFDPTDSAISKHVLNMIDNRNRRKDYVFRAHKG